MGSPFVLVVLKSNKSFLPVQGLPFNVRRNTDVIKASDLPWVECMFDAFIGIGVVMVEC
jgi:hypothetical protein